jgi:flavin reductase (DIM6/NTAB) family NADH-FMN oxidoreductase RutF
MPEPGVGIDPATFQELLRNVPVPVAILTTSNGGQRDGLTVSSFTSVSLNPPLISVSLTKDKPATTLTLLAGHFALNLLGADASDLADRFASHHTLPRFDNIAIEEGPVGLPTLTVAVAVLYARTQAIQKAGDHYLITGQVFAAHNNGGAPLIRYLSQYTAPLMSEKFDTPRTCSRSPITKPPPSVDRNQD